MQVTLYIRKENEQFKSEPNKSELINKLLSKHYGTAKKGMIGKVEHVQVEESKQAPGYIMSTPGAPRQPETPKPQYVPPTQNFAPTRKRVIKKPLRRRSDLI